MTFLMRVNFNPIALRKAKIAYNLAFLSAIELTPCLIFVILLADISGSIELFENSLTFEGVQWRKIIQC